MNFKLSESRSVSVSAYKLYIFRSKNNSIVAPLDIYITTRAEPYFILFQDCYPKPNASLYSAWLGRFS